MTETDETTRSRARRVAYALAAFVLAVCSLASCGKDVSQQEPLPSLGATGVVTVSGISSGGYMAGQYLVAFSKQVSGAGIVAAGPWGCANGDLTRALKICITGEGIDNEELHELAKAKVAANDIDGSANLNDSRLFVFRGSNDAVMSATIVDEVSRWFARYMDDSNIEYVSDVPVVHGWPTADYGNECDAFATPFVNNCGYDLAGELLAHLHPGLRPPATAAHAVRRFDQRPFGDASLADFGYVYVPASCESTAGCSVHVFFHGCEQSANTIGKELVDNAGFNRWAETNNIVVLYPQVEKSGIAPMNPLGCWDWWGYTGQDYLARTGPQLAAVRMMVEQLR